MTARITEHTGQVRGEIVAPRVELFWNPDSDEGRAVFHMQKIVSLDGETISTHSAGRLEHTVTLGQGRVFNVPTGEIDANGNPVTVAVSTELLVAGIKTAFDTLFNEQV